MIYKFKSDRQRKMVMAKLKSNKMNYYVNPYTGDIMTKLNDTRQLTPDKDYPRLITKKKIYKIISSFKR